MADKELKVAIVCDWLTGIGGSERVILQLHKLYPQAPIYTSQYDPSKIDWFEGADIRTLWLQKLPAGLKKFLPVLRAWAFSRLDLSEYDLVISAGGAEAKAVHTGSNTLHVNYCYAPTHYYWSRYEEYMKHPGFGALNWLARLGLGLLLFPMRAWDRRAARRADAVIGISSHIKNEIKKYYGRDASVIHPPVNTRRFKSDLKRSRSGYLTAGRQTAYKRFDLAVKACSQLELPLTVAGDGPDNSRLRTLASHNTTFLTDVPDDEMTKLMQTAAAFVFPGLDDFGIVAVEAMAAGTPVIAYRAGGALDYVIDGKTGLFFNEPSAGSLADTLQRFKPEEFDSQVIMEHAEQFSENKFQEKMLAFINRALEEKTR